MVKNIIISLLFGFSYNLNSQTYELLNDRLNSKDTIYIKNKFEKLDDDIIKKYLTESFIQNNWEPLPMKDLPNINLFLENFNLEDAMKTAFRNNNSDSIIDFSKLKTNLIKVTDTAKHLKNNKNYLVLTKPIFNENKSWAISYLYAVYYLDIGRSGELVIFRKLKGKWVKFHDITIWIS